MLSDKTVLFQELNKLEKSLGARFSATNSRVASHGVLQSPSLQSHCNDIVRALVWYRSEEYFGNPTVRAAVTKPK